MDRRSELATLALPSLVVLLSLVLPQSSAPAAEITAESRIDAVTVFANEAQISRLIDTALEPGTLTLHISGLPLALQRQSLRVETVSGDVSIGRVVVRERASIELVGNQERELSQKIVALERQKHVRSDRIEAQRIKLDLIRKLSGKVADQANETLLARDIAPERWRESWNIVVDGAEEALEAIRLAEEDQSELQIHIDKAQRDLEQLQTGAKASIDAAIDLRAGSATQAKLRLVYQIDNVGWQPIYDARLDTEGKELTIEQLAMVAQTTGEDWTDVQLTLSTSTPSRGSLPALEPWPIDVVEPIAPMAASEAASPKQRSLALAAPPRVLADVQAQGVVSEFAAAYAVDGRVTIPADSSSHRVLLDRTIQGVELRAEAVPKLQPVAWLVAALTHGGEAPFPAGQINLFRDGAFVGESWLDRLQPGEKRDLSFGIDDRIDLDYRLDRGQRSSEGIITSYRRIERHYLIEATSHHTVPIELTLLDQTPVPQDERIEVELTEESTPPTISDAKDRRGVLAWTRTLEPGEGMQVRFGFAVTYPADVEVGGF